MRFNPRARIDESQIENRGGGGGFGGAGMRLPIPSGGGGRIGLGTVVVIILYVVISALSGNNPVPGAGGSSDQGSTATSNCRTGADANRSQDCAIDLITNSVQAYWSTAYQEQSGQAYQQIRTVKYSGQTSSGCGTASSAMGPFYCPNDKRVYIDKSFMDDMLTGQLGAKGGPFALAYVIAHEYGHHIENLRGVFDKARSRDTGPQSDGVRLELQADCLAGMWAKGAVETGYIEDLTDADIRDGLNAASAIGDDRIQQQVQGQVSPESWTHGSSEQRQKWFLTGFRATTDNACDTFAVRTV